MSCASILAFMFCLDSCISLKRLPQSYNDIGVVYHCIGHYSKAVSYFENALKLPQLSLPSDHPYLKQLQKSSENRAKEIVISHLLHNRYIQYRLLRCTTDNNRSIG